MEKIIIKNFGPIKNVELELKDINIFIGHTSSGKSTVAKLVAILKDPDLLQTHKLDEFKSKLIEYNIDFELKRSTYIHYCYGELYWELKTKKISHNSPFRELLEIFNEAHQSIIGDIKEKGIDLKKVPLEGQDFHNLKALLLTNFGSSVNLLNVSPLTGSPEEKIKRALALSSEVKNRQKKVKSGDYNHFFKVLRDVTDVYLLVYGDSNSNHVCYIPAERTLLSMIAESLFGLMNHDVSIAKCIKDFGAQFETARKKLTHFPIPFLDIEYKYSDKSNFIAFDDGVKIKLEQASSGLQSIIPLLLVVEANTTEENTFVNYLLIEEPELNLYPTVQKELMEFVIERINRSNNKLIITTHSPYILTSLDNLIQAKNVAKLHPETKDKVSKIVPEQKWVSFDRVACYFFEDGKCRSTLDTENQTIGASNIDDVSEALGMTFDQLLELKYSHVS